MSRVPDVSVVIINYNSVAFTRTCLRTLFANTKDVSLEVIVLDNASHDRCKELLEDEFRNVTFVQNERNLGFAGANNRGAAMAHAEHILFLNPDTEIRGNAIGRLSRQLTATAGAGIVGGRLLNSDRSVQTTSITAFPSIANQVFGAEYLRKRWPRARMWGIHPLFENSSGPVRVDAVSGACMMVRKEAFQLVQGFTTDYFMYGEDLDLCLKVTRAGWKVYYVSDAVIVHHGGKSSASRTEENYADVMIRQSTYRFMNVHGGRGQASLFKAATACSALARLLFVTGLTPILLFPSGRRFVRRVWRKWARVLAWCIGLQRWVLREAAASVRPPDRSTSESSKTVQWTTGT